MIQAQNKNKVKVKAEDNRTPAGKISVMGSSSIAGSNGGLVMSGTGPSGSVSSVTVQGK